MYGKIKYKEKCKSNYKGNNVLKISNAPLVRKPSCKHVDGQCDLDL
jgi:hypothetical protein